MIPAWITENLTRIAVYAALGLMLIACGWLDGYRRGELKLFEYQAKEATATIALVKKIEKVKEIVRVVHVQREIEIQQVFVPIEKEAANVPSRSVCNVTAGWLRLHDAAAEGRDRRGIGAVDDATDTGIAEARADAVVVANYKSFHQVANDLVACRSFVSGLKAATKP